MKITVGRYNFNKELICIGELEVIQDCNEHKTILVYTDKNINITASELYHPIKSLESLRKILESQYSSILAINGCRIDTSYRATGHHGQYIIEWGKQTSMRVSMFEPTTEIDKLGTIEEHKKAYLDWANSLLNN